MRVGINLMQYGDRERNFLIAASSLHSVGPVTLRKILEASAKLQMDITDICLFSEAELLREAGVSAHAVKELGKLASPIERGEQIHDQLRERDGSVVFEDEGEYPEQLKRFLGRGAPLLLFATGNTELLCNACIGVVGSRRPSRQAADAARSFSAQLAAEGWTIVSGAATGIDSCGHAGALSAGNTVLLPPEGILNFRWPQMAGGIPAENNWCLASSFPPHAGWETKHALMRNKMITALSSAVVAFEPRDRGGTWHSANTAIEMGKPLFVASAGMDRLHGVGFKKLIGRGAQPLECAQMPSNADFESMLAAYQIPPGKKQKPLFHKKGKEGRSEEGR